MEITKALSMTFNRNNAEVKIAIPRVDTTLVGSDIKTQADIITNTNVYGTEALPMSEIIKAEYRTRKVSTLELV